MYTVPRRDNVNIIFSVFLYNNVYPMTSSCWKHALFKK